MPLPIEQHPLAPFLPEGSRLLMLGSFPPQQKRWCMDFFYPNFSNDMWRIFGLIFFDDPLHFVDTEHKTFRMNEIIEFLNTKGVGIYDTACAVRRLQGNASDKYLEVVTPTDIEGLLTRMPRCRAIVTTGQKATDTICERFGITQPKMGASTTFRLGDEEFRLYRMPSSSRAYPIALAKKAEAYRGMFEEIFGEE